MQKHMSILLSDEDYKTLMEALARYNKAGLALGTRLKELVRELNAYRELHEKQTPQVE